MRLFLFPIPIPIPIRVAAIGGTILYVLLVATKSPNAGGHAAHLAGMAAGALYVFSNIWQAKTKLKIQTFLWHRRMAALDNLRSELDRILQKVHDSGLHSLTMKEKRTLKKATKAERTRRDL
jgi:hypothetical protein